METLIRDVQYALRSLRNTPAFTAVAIATLALGIGVNSAIFSLVNAVLLKPLPVERPSELVDIYGHRNTDSDHGTSSYLDYLDYRSQSETLTDIAAYTNFFANLATEGRSELVVGEIVSGNYFDVLGVRPALGRGFLPEEVVSEGSHPVVVLGHEFWRTRFAEDADVLGETVRLNGIPYTVVGVAPAGFGGMLPAVTSQMWVPVMMVEEVEPLGNQRWTGSVGGPRLQHRGMRWLWMRGRMRAGTSVAEVRAELTAIAGRLSAEYAEHNEFEAVTILATSDVHINPDFDGTLVPAGLLILGVVGLVLLVACANLANMLLARAAVRRREIAIRLAIGAGRRRLVRQLVTESLTLALMGGVAGLALATVAAELIARFQPPLPIQVGLDIAPDWRVLVFTLIAAGITGLAFGLVPALRASRPDLVPALKNAEASDAAGRALHLRDALVVLQVAVSIVLLVAGALMMRSLAAAQQVDLGFDAERLSFYGMPMEMNGYDRDRSAVFFETARQRVEALPGVEAVANMSRVPQSVNDNNFGLVIDGHQTSAADRPYLTGGAYVDEHYFDTLEVPIVQGRGIEFADRSEGRLVAVVTEALAGRYWPDGTALGQQLRTGWDGDVYVIVGVARDYRVNTPGEAPTPYMHLPYPERSVFGNFVVRTTAPAAAAVTAIEAAIRSVDAEFLFLDTGAMGELVDVRLFPIRLGAWLMGAFGLLALVLAAIGLYGVIGYSVSRRTREIGIRMALGAEAGRVLKLVLRQGMTLVIVGAAVGAVAAAFLARLLASVLFVPAIDPVSFLFAIGFLSAVALLANWMPAARAARVDPMVALRSE